MIDINNLIASSAAPFNREERFFTGTVLPLLVSGDDFKDLKPLIDLMAPSLNLNPEYSDTRKSVLFYTEYNLKKSGYVKTGITRPDESTTKIDGDTPDILFYVWDNDKIYLFAIEVKMYHKPTADNLALQLQRQYVVLKALASKANIPVEHIFHYALVPAKTSLSYTNKSKLLTWEQIYDLYRTKAVNRYAIDALGYALKEYDNLVAKQTTGKNNSTETLSGWDIMNNHEAIGIKYVGCSGGRNGERFLRLAITDKWKYNSFQITTASTCPNRNWFPIEEFLNAVNN